jgi:hypothetical protein
MKVAPTSKPERRIRTIILAAFPAAIASAALAFAPDAVTAGRVPYPDVPAADGTGSVISSFRMTGVAKPYALGIYRDASYVHGVIYGGDKNYLYRFTPAGARVSSYVLNGTSTPRDADDAHLGAGYLALVDARKRYLFVFSTAGGAAITSFPVAGSPFPLNCFWDGAYYHANGPSDRGEFNRYAATGASAGTWSCAGWPDGMTYCGGAAYAARGNNAAGPYVVACSWLAREPMCMTTFPTGSLVQSWTPPAENGNGLVYGKSSQPGAYGNAVWAAWFTGASLDAFEFDIGARGGPAVAPASLGRIKSLYR